ncbi:phosphotransferase [Rhodobacter sp. Har01]|uniref:phosphotransferase n=1 Tax=Rhodobacter sp. Har01 TaxID=2883999 RepID=UPI001D091902|nr:phosphotransferase [Rhodobacter sp. Har01]MCB6179936.1 phosphotransferase [Rhodobacter sp. Har01]
MSDITITDPAEESARAALGDMLHSPAPVIDAAAAARIVSRHYGIRAAAHPLACERDANFQMVPAQGKGCILKVSNPAEPAVSIQFQNQALLWLERRDPGLPVPKVVPALDGRSEFLLEMPDGRSSMVRLLTWLDGVPVARIGVSPALRRDLGRTLARLGAALVDFDHPGASHAILWDIKHALRLRPLLASLPRDALKSQLLAELDHFDAEVAPLLPGLRQQVVHNDLNLHNVLLNPDDPDRVTGVLDFGDMVKTPLVIDLAVAASYQTHLGDDALASACEIVGAYHGVRPLERREVALLRDLIVARLMTSIVITEWRAARYPQNAAYILRNNGPARIGMARFASLPRETTTAALLAACQMESTP